MRRGRSRVSVSAIPSFSIEQLNAMSLRNVIGVTVAIAGPLGIELHARYDTRSSRVVVEVVNVKQGSAMDALGVRIGDWVQEVHNAQFDLLNEADLDGVRVCNISTAFACVLRVAISELAAANSSSPCPPVLSRLPSPVSPPPLTSLPVARVATGATRLCRTDSSQSASSPSFLTEFAPCPPMKFKMTR